MNNVLVELARRSGLEAAAKAYDAGLSTPALKVTPK